MLFEAFSGPMRLFHVFRGPVQASFGLEKSENRLGVREDFEDVKMLTGIFKKMVKKDSEGYEHLGPEEFRKLVETYEFRSYLQTRGGSESHVGGIPAQDERAKSMII